MPNVIFKKDNEIIATELDVAIVQHYANDMRTQEVAEKAGINVRTMETLIGKMKLKFGVKTVHGLVYLFSKENLLT